MEGFDEDGPIGLTHRTHNVREQYSDTAPSWSDPETHFHLVMADTTRGGRNSVDDLPDAGFGAPTGEVECCECGQSAMDIEDICHEPDCSQKEVMGDYRFGRVIGFDILDELDYVDC